MVTTLPSGRKGILLQAIAVGCLFVAAGAFGHPAAGQAGDWRGSPANDFPLAGGDYSNQRYSALDQINTTNIDKLRGAWSIHIDEGGPAGNLDGTPIVVNGVMYVSTARQHVLAIDAATGAIKWRYRPGSETR